MALYAEEPRALPAKVRNLNDALGMFISRAEQRKLSVETVNSARGQAVARRRIRVAGKRCTIHALANVQTQSNSRRIYGHTSASGLLNVDAAVFVFLAPEVRGRIVIIPAKKILQAYDEDLYLFQLTFPLHSPPKGQKPRRYNWWEYEDNWEFFTPRL